MKKLLLLILTAVFSYAAQAQEAPKAVDLGLSVLWADVDTAPEADIPAGWRMPSLAEIKELREGCTQSVEDREREEWVVFTAKNGNSISFLWPIGSRSARAFSIIGEDGCYLKETILNPLLKQPGHDGYYTWEELEYTHHGQRKYPVRLVKE